MKKKNKIIITLLILVVVLSGLFSYNLYRKDPNLLYKRIIKHISLNKEKDVSFDYAAGKNKGKGKIPVYVFNPKEDGSYAFTISDIETSEDIYLTMSVCDMNLNDYILADNTADHSDQISGSEYFNAGTKCLIIIDAVSAEDLDRYSGSFSIEVTRSNEDLKPAELKVSSPVSVTVTNDEKASVHFVPESDGFYRFTAELLSQNNDSGYASVESIKTDRNKTVKDKDGICWLDKGEEYYAWISAAELSNPTAVAMVNVDSMETFETSETGSYDIDASSVIVFKANDTENYAVYSESDGEVMGSVYDKKGFQLNFDSNSGGPLSGNENDFAFVLQAQKGQTYAILADGEFSKCRIVITEYTGDGRSLGKEDVAPLSEE